MGHFGTPEIGTFKGYFLAPKRAGEVTFKKWYFENFINPDLLKYTYRRH